MLASEHLNTAPLLILANKQDISGCLTVLDIKRVFHDSSTKIGSRDCMIRPVSALTGLVAFCGCLELVVKKKVIL